VLDLPRLVVAAPNGRSGKTTAALGLAALCTRRGLAVQPFKKGPDFIDPSWLSAAAGRACRNLDLFLMGEEGVITAFALGARRADLALVEGAMGLYDGTDLEGSGSTANVARLLNAPVLLVLDASRMTRTAAAIVQGLQHFEPGIRIAGVILNHVSGARHEKMLRDALRQYCGLPVLGALPRDEALKIPERHLGLVPRGENQALDPALTAIRDAVEAHVDIDQVLTIARSAPPLASPTGKDTAPAAPSVRIGVALDRAFTFYYPENLESLRAAGAELAFLDTLEDAHLPAVDALYIGGGFPELFLNELEANESLRSEIRAAIKSGLPVYAECGGLMYLARQIRWNGRCAQMVGALPCDVELGAKPQGHGYVAVQVVRENPWFAFGTQLRGHEFHHSRLTSLGDVAFAYRVSRGNGIDGARDGLVHKNVIASYMHLHAASTPQWAERMVDMARQGGCVR
jgi:cobyrinic acid a,c-diamide synthase